MTQLAHKFCSGLTGLLVDFRSQSVEFMLPKSPLAEVTICPRAWARTEPGLEASVSQWLWNCEDVEPFLARKVSEIITHFLTQKRISSVDFLAEHHEASVELVQGQEAHSFIRPLGFQNERKSST